MCLKKIFFSCLHLLIQMQVKDEVSRGKVVTTHTNNVSVPGWSGVRYIVVNPKTGDGGYYISGGENGGFLNPVQSGQNTFMGIIFGISEMLAKGDWFIEGMFKLVSRLTVRLGIANNVMTLLNNDCHGAIINLYLLYDLILQELTLLLSVYPLIGLLMMAFSIVMQDLLMSTLLKGCKVAFNTRKKPLYIC